MNWIKEKEAAEMIGRKPQSLRKNVKSGKWPVGYTAPNGRGYMYSERDIEKLLNSYSSKIKSA